MRQNHIDDEAETKATRANNAEIKRLQMEAANQQKSVIKIGDKFDCDAYGKVEVVDIYESQTYKSVKFIYEVIELEHDGIILSHLATAEELDDYERKTD